MAASDLLVNDMDNIIKFPKKSKIRSKEVKDRYLACIEHMNDTNTLCICEYCSYLSSKGHTIGKALFSVMKRDETKNDMVFCKNDALIILWEAIQYINSIDFVEKK